MLQPRAARSWPDRLGRAIGAGSRHRIAQFNCPHPHGSVAGCRKGANFPGSYPDTRNPPGSAPRSSATAPICFCASCLMAIVLIVPAPFGFVSIAAADASETRDKRGLRCPALMLTEDRQAPSHHAHGSPRIGRGRRFVALHHQSTSSVKARGHGTTAGFPDGMRAPSALRTGSAPEPSRRGSSSPSRPRWARQSASSHPS